MIPYFEVPPFEVFGVMIQPFGLLLTFGVIFGYVVVVKEARRRGLPEGYIDKVTLTALACGLIGSALGDTLFYRPGDFLADPLAALDFTKHMASTSGFLFGSVAGLLAVWLLRGPYLLTTMVVYVGLAHGWVLARLGCAIAHDHPGTLSNFPLAVKFPLGARHDLGFYEFMFTAGLVICLNVIDRDRMSPAKVLSLIAIPYCLFRFMADFLRIGDTRYFGLTPAQYFCLAVLGGFACAFIRRCVKNRLRPVLLDQASHRPENPSERVG